MLPNRVGGLVLELQTPVDGKKPGLFFGDQVLERDDVCMDVGSGSGL